mgnify:CR=1 FL=1
MRENEEVHVCRECQYCHESFTDDPFYDKCLVYNSSCTLAKTGITCPAYTKKEYDIDKIGADVNGIILILLIVILICYNIF